MWTSFFHMYPANSVQILVIESISVTVAMYCLIQFYVQLKTDLAHHRPFLKVLAIKLVIFLSFWQSFTISILTSSSLEAVKPTSKIAYPDLKVGIPAVLLCIEMTFFSILHLWAFPYAPYAKGATPAKFPISTPSINSGMDGPGPKQGGFLGMNAMIDAMNPWDLVKAFARGMKWLFVGRKTRENDSSYKNSGFDNDAVTLGDAGGLNKSDTAYNGAMGLPIANQFRRSNFGMPAATARDEEGDGLIAHAQPNPLNSGSANYAHPGKAYDYGQPANPPYPDNQRHDYSGQDIGAGGGRYNPNQDSTEYSSPYGKVQGRSIRPNDDPYQSADIGMAIGDSEPSRSQAYGDPRRPKPSEQWKNSSRATTPPAGEDERFFPGGQQGRPGGNVI